MFCSLLNILITVMMVSFSIKYAVKNIFITIATFSTVLYYFKIYVLLIVTGKPFEFYEALCYSIWYDDNYNN